MNFMFRFWFFKIFYFICANILISGKEATLKSEYFCSQAFWKKYSNCVGPAMGGTMSHLSMLPVLAAELGGVWNAIFFFSSDLYFLLFYILVFTKAN